MRSRQRAFTLIEVLVVVAIIGVLLALGVPAFNNYLNNVRLRIAAENFLAGLQMARSEAIRLNTNVEFLLTNEPPIPDSGSDANYPVLQDASQAGRYAANQVNANVDGYNWLVRTRPAAGCVANAGGDQNKACWWIAGKTGAEGGGLHNSGSSTPIAINSGGTQSVLFTPFGDTTAATFDFSNPGAGNCVADEGTVRCLRVNLTTGGRVRVCDPSISGTSDTRSCN
ncbi:MAG TPA: GspH/FimT family pseudopilin [Accumulibacter sp.]|nr:GspH/FimT family pseudopilin [Accumulibacter sp.]HMW17643.1 GspH/FimT family pseudopilin [Accumulibacter sp.]HMX22833.1 GspH/FimT family pseudopilin [Accumulibacter sp.]HMY06063.1 GspH/FimT family pseudopilin [Accumulibacter sp.]HNC18426.1 GspH/FimT family pseudopilin [Accumulibacter sp.]